MFTQLSSFGSRFARSRFNAAGEGNSRDTRPASASQGFATIAVSGHQSIQGPILRELWDGRVTIDSGNGQITGYPMTLRHDQREASFIPMFGGYC